MNKVDIGDKHVFRIYIGHYRGEHLITVALEKIKRDEPRGFVREAEDDIYIDGVERSQMERLIQNKMEELAYESGLTTEQRAEVEILKNIAHEIDEMYPYPPIVKKKWWKR